jgi:hypothetical protein
MTEIEEKDEKEDEISIDESKFKSLEKQLPETIIPSVLLEFSFSFSLSEKENESTQQKSEAASNSAESFSK